ncbi:MAG: Threonine-tRNA ligase [Candidatus Daviesbacteria bacterium GW2011_GWA2_38_24]|uniref:Threonine--tRNA ligase n=1 Tax=Candidatus Daviesbacteria bacterium GW2011_GWA2_38_24 TaxID=1618422 RepID=A0A0G0JCC0_9BACT|nr:MAG: Threonine-tRNA ligase [Candidatus Daviesbacteria bacterium GW2011_GWA2_38_24]KKQ79139.1 MAG: Threonine-tRNA ligase [Candidatus Daviesbacteria bacterium GW2011_GWA1_38_7]
MNSDHNKLTALRHSAAHLLAAAVNELYPGTQFGIGPVIENGFYYDFDLPKPIAEEDLPRIEKLMQELRSKNYDLRRSEETVKQALEQTKDQPYKQELINDLEKAGEPKVSFYTLGEFKDLCAGPHIKNTKEIGPFKLLSIAGAYWRGSEKNKMLTRIYGTAFETKEKLDKYLNQLDEAKKRDHRKIGKELNLFVFSDLVGKGLPLFTPKGTLLREKLNSFSQELRIKRGFERVWIPHITNKKLYEISGHWAKFGKELFLVTSQETDEELVMKPMNCPHHQQIYASKMHSYRDLPIKYIETTTIYRDEKAGELLGLSRVRSVTQDDSHVFCTPSQIETVYRELIEIIKKFYDVLGMSYKARLSFRAPNQPEKYLGDVELWNKAQDILLTIAKENNLDYYIAEGEAAFYGPKIDFMVMDAIGREWQLATPQLDFVQPQRFGLKYINEKGEEQTPVMIHFALMGSIERFLSVYIEHTAGNFPTWLAPTQVQIIPIADRHNEYGQKVLEQLNSASIRAEIDTRSEKMQAKIREAQLQKIPYMLIVGDKETHAGTVSIRTRSGENLESMKTKEFVEKMKSESHVAH